MFFSKVLTTLVILYPQLFGDKRVTFSYLYGLDNRHDYVLISPTYRTMQFFQFNLFHIFVVARRITSHANYE